VSWFFGNAIDRPTGASPNRSRLAQLGTSITAPAARLHLPRAERAGDRQHARRVSDLRVLSAPSVLVRNNVEADFNSGQQIPVASTILNNNGNTNTDNTYSQVQFRQTGVSLR
jgi:general secretion pathway protein D